MGNYMTPNDSSKDENDRINIIQTVKTPLGFFVLVVLVVEAIFGIIAATTSGDERMYIITFMFILIFSVVLIVAFLAYSKPLSLAGIREQNGDSDAVSNQEVNRYDILERYFDSTNRNFSDDLQQWTVKGTEKQWYEVIKMQSDKNYVKLWRLVKEPRVVLSIRNYQTPHYAPSNRYIPPDTNPSLVGEEIVRLIYCQFDAKVDKTGHKVNIRLRKDNSHLIKGYLKEIFVRNRDWKTYSALLGPIRADQPCHISLDIMPGPSGSSNALYIRNLIIEEWREQDE